MSLIRKEKIKVTENNEQDLIRGVLKKDTASMKVLYDFNVRYLSAVCSRYIVREEDIKDVLQESFIKIFTALRHFSYKGKGSLQAWMKRIVVNEALMFLRKQNKTSFISSDSEIPESIIDEEPSVEEISSDVLFEMIRGLSDGYRTILNLYVFERKSHKEIAKLLGISENTSFSQYYRAKKALAIMIRKYLEDAK